jgi:Skp family chaperone for outer membrane proteins
MKATLFALFFVSLSFFSKAQAPYTLQTKIAVFDIDLMVQAMPQYKVVDSLIRIYENDTLGPEYEILQNEAKRLDSIVTAHFHKMMGDGMKFIDSVNKKRIEVTMNLVYWQQYAQKKDSIKRRTLSEPLYRRVKAAFFKVLNEKKYDYILKPNVIKYNNNIDNLFIPVAKELNLTSLPDNLSKIGNKELLNFP